MQLGRDTQHIIRRVCPHQIARLGVGESSESESSARTRFLRYYAVGPYRCTRRVCSRPNGRTRNLRPLKNRPLVRRSSQSEIYKCRARILNEKPVSVWYVRRVVDAGRTWIGPAACVRSQRAMSPWELCTVHTTDVSPFCTFLFRDRSCGENWPSRRAEVHSSVFWGRDPIVCVFVWETFAASQQAHNFCCNWHALISRREKNSQGQNFSFLLPQ